MGLLFFLLFFIFAALGVELFGRIECSEENPCQGLGEHAHFANFGMAFLTLFRVATGDNWNGIMKDTLRGDDCDPDDKCVKNCCVSNVIAPIYFVIFVLMAQFVLVNVVVAVLMKHLEESHKQMEDELDMDTELEKELEREQEFEEEQALCMQLKEETNMLQKRPLEKVSSLPSDFTFKSPVFENCFSALANRRQTLQYIHQNRPNSIDYSANYLQTTYEDDFDKNEINQYDTNSITSIKDGLDINGVTKKEKVNWKNSKIGSINSLESERSLIIPIIKSSKNHLKKSSMEKLSTDIKSVNLNTNTIGSKSNKGTDIKINRKIEPITNKEKTFGNFPKRFGRSMSTDQGKVPRSKIAKELKKQNTLSEDYDENDEKCLLLPILLQQISNKTGSNKTVPTSNENLKHMIPQDTTTNKNNLQQQSDEVLRIVTERRLADKKSVDLKQQNESITLTKPLTLNDEK